MNKSNKKSNKLAFSNKTFNNRMRKQQDKGKEGRKLSYKCSF
jgi:hypothetical protein